MKKLSLFIIAGLLVATTAMAAVTVNSGPVSLVTSAVTAKASSAPIVLFSVNLGQTAGETLSSVAVNIANNGSSVATGADLASVKVYKDDGNGLFDSAVDALAGSQTTVNIGSATTVTTSANNTIIASGDVFFVTLQTSASWSDVSPADSVTVTLPVDGIVTSANSPTTTAVTTSTITADTTLPVITIASYTTTPVNTDITVTASVNEGTLNTTSHTFTANGSFSFVATDAAGNSTTQTVTITNIDKTVPTLSLVVAKNTGGTNAKEAGDTIAVKFSEATNQAVINTANIATTLVLNNTHSFLDGAGVLGATSWSADGKILTITLTAGTSIPTVALGDTVTIAGDVIKDLANNSATGTQTITGSFSGKVSDDDEGDDDQGKKVCSNSLINGRLYRVGTGETVYLAASCTLKVFKGSAVGKAEGKKFKNIITLETMPLPGVKVKSESDLSKKDKDRIQNIDGDQIFRDIQLEKKALKLYTQLFRKLPKSGLEWKTLNFLAYGGEISDRDMAAEIRAIRTYVTTFKRVPKTAEDWAALHALAYGS